MTTLRDAAQQALEALENGAIARPGWVPDYDDAITSLRAAMEQSMEDACYKLLQEALPHAEWQDKHVYPVSQEAYQNWKLTIYLPVRLSETDKSPEAALARAVEAEVLKRTGVGK